MFNLETEGFAGVVVVVVVGMISLPLSSFFLTPSLTWVCLQATALKLLVLVSSLDVVDLGFFLSDRIGELDPRDRGLLDASGLEESDDFFEEKNNLFLNTISFSGFFI